ncbi:Gfo/Idh/MocA family protein [Bacillus massilinigeriensis]|uniref:Gfo/Idh/MocA family protein n=1 Tax=Bacillus massilionigeriensis TaxID=1805475 RepID=UPI00096AEA04|nr:Gfo/Idh/MocA family oxidoreductase [Bacillus massilionigeriensis]
MKKVKIGVIGAGSIAQMGHLPFYQNHPGVELEALVDVNEERAKNIASQYGIKKTFSNAEEMFEQISLDAVSICTTNNTHVPLAKLSLQNGSHVLVEKPLSLTYEEALEVEEIANQQGKICMIGMTHRFRNDTKAMKAFIDAGNLGDIYFTRARILQRRNTPAGWFTNKTLSGGGPLMDIGVHVLDLAWWLTGKEEVASVSGHLVQGIGPYETIMQNRWESAESMSNGNHPFDVEDFASAFIRFENGMVLHLEVSWAMNGPSDDSIKIDIFGTKGGMSLSPLCYYSEENHILSDSKLNVTANNPFEDEIHHFVDAVIHDQKPLVETSDGVYIMKLLNLIADSSHLKRELKLTK